ncbi:MAG TPA: hypothetical protein VFJ07_06680 [Streptosporangiaceae bacterium]|nr:hypothetical protein [Streptosporangiaceae bacterium]
MRAGPAAGRQAMLRRRGRRADDLMGETLDRRGEHVSEGGGRAASEHNGRGGHRRADLDPEPGGEPAGATAGPPGQYRRASPAPELGQSAVLTGPLLATGLGGQRGQDVSHGPQPGDGVRRPGKQCGQVGVRHDGLVLALRLREV